MDRSPAVLWMAAVFAGLTTLLVGAGVVTGSVFVVFVALPLGVTAAIMWYHGSGRLVARMRARAASRPRDGPAGRTTRSAGARQGYRTVGDRRRTRTAGDGPFADGGGGPFTGEGGRFGRRRRRGGGPGGRTRAGGRGGRSVPRSGMSAREAARVLGVDPDADEATVKRAYRRKAKEYHPDVEGGDEAAFKRVTEAYERLS